MNYRCCLIVVEDLAKSRYLYGHVLNQQVTADYGENIVFDGFAIHEKKHFSSLLDDDAVTPGRNTHELYFEDEDPAALEPELARLGLSPVHPTREQPWRQRVLRFYDYDGHLVEVGEPLEHTAYRLSREGMPLEEICKTTYLEEDAVKKALHRYRQDQ